MARLFRELGEGAQRTWEDDRIGANCCFLHTENMQLEGRKSRRISIFGRKKKKKKTDLDSFDLRPSLGSKELSGPQAALGAAGYTISPNCLPRVGEVAGPWFSGSIKTSPRSYIFWAVVV